MSSEDTNAREAIQYLASEIHKRRCGYGSVVEEIGRILAPPAPALEKEEPSRVRTCPSCRRLPGDSHQPWCGELKMHPIEVMGMLAVDLELAYDAGRKRGWLDIARRDKSGDGFADGVQAGCAIGSSAALIPPKGHVRDEDGCDYVVLAKS